MDNHDPLDCESDEIHETHDDASTNAYRLFTGNVHKAGLATGHDKALIDQRVYELSKNSRFFQNEERKGQKTEERVQKMRDQYVKLQSMSLRFEERVIESRIQQLEQSDRQLDRVIVHIDMDAFYAAVEMRDNPELNGKPVIVGGMSMVSAANYVARKFGVRSAMPGFIAKQLCPDLIMIPPNFDKYRESSRQVQTILERYDANFDMMSLDEAYLDITDYLQTLEPPCSREDIVQKLREEIFQETKLTASAGIAANRMLAKICSDMNKPNGQFSLENDREKIIQFMHDLPVRRISGIGKVTERILAGLEITTCKELYEKRVYVYKLFSQTSFDFLLRVALGIGSTQVGGDWNRKSMSTERTFATMEKPEQMLEKLRELSDALSEDLKSESLRGKTVTLKLKTIDFEVKTRAKTLNRYICSADDIYNAAKPLLEAEMPIQIRLMGLRMSAFANEGLRVNHSITNYLLKAPHDESGIDHDEIKPDEAEAAPEIECKADNTTLTKGAAQTDTFERGESSLESVKEQYRCPICQQIVLEAVRSLDNLKFNQHLDTCLNRGTLKEINHQSTSDSRPSKKHKKDKKPAENEGNSNVLFKFIQKC